MEKCTNADRPSAQASAGTGDPCWTTPPPDHQSPPSATRHWPTRRPARHHHCHHTRPPAAHWLPALARWMAPIPAPTNHDRQRRILSRPRSCSEPKPPCCPPNQSQYLRDGICKVLSLHAALRSLCHGLAAVSRRRMEVGDMPMRGRCSLSGHAHASTAAVPVLYRRWDVGAHMHTYTTWWALLCRTGGPTYIHACRQSQRFHGASPLVFPLTLPV